MFLSPLRCVFLVTSLLFVASNSLLSASLSLLLMAPWSLCCTRASLMVYIVDHCWQLFPTVCALLMFICTPLTGYFSGLHLLALNCEYFCGVLVAGLTIFVICSTIVNHWDSLIWLRDVCSSLLDRLKDFFFFAMYVMAKIFLTFGQAFVMVAKSLIGRTFEVLPFCYHLMKCVMSVW